MNLEGHYSTQYRNELNKCSLGFIKTHRSPETGGLGKPHSSAPQILTEHPLQAGPCSPGRQSVRELPSTPCAGGAQAEWKGSTGGKSQRAAGVWMDTEEGEIVLGQEQPLVD